MASPVTTPSSTPPPSSPPRQQGPPIRINLTRPNCFCGFTSVSVYPEPTVIGTLDNPEPAKPVREANWVYECHFTPKQRGMVRPDPCEDCEEDRQRSLARVKAHAANSTTKSGTSTRMSSKGSEKDKDSSRVRHRPEKVDQVQLCPTEVTTPKPSRTTTATTTTTTRIGVDIGKPAKFKGLGATDGFKVCGFHMHALEWHHMQTIGVEDILALAKQTGCEVFNLSVVRCLADLVRPTTSGPVATTAATTTTSSSNKSNTHNIYAGNSTTMGLKLFQTIRCECKRESVIAIAPRHMPPSPANSSTQAQGNEKHYVIACRGRAHLDPSFKITEPRLDGDEFYGYQTRAWANVDAQAYKCSFCISADIAIYGHANEAIHKWIPTNPWLSQWFPTPTKSAPRKALARSALPVPTSRSPLLSRSLPSAAATRGAPNGSSTLAAVSPRLTEQMVSTIQRSLTLSETTTKRSPTYLTAPNTLSSRSTPTSTATAPVAPPSAITPRLLTAQDFERLGQQVLGKTTNTVAVLEELDRELEVTVAWHVTEVTWIMGAHSSPPWSPYSQTSDHFASPIAAKQEYTNYLEFDMEKMYPGIAMHLCQWCKDHVRDFCVVPLYVRNGQDTSRITTRTTHRSDWPLPPSPPRSPEYPVDTDYASDTTSDSASSSTYTELELERVDKELERVMERHAEVVLELFESRSRLVPGLVLCRGCDYYHTEGQDVVPCSHALLCIECVRRVEFYLVPLANTSSSSPS
ncbi:hypothetical protein BGW39_002614 [Mortierella sp. 14UC]|nr:hypothetical protein BGW39_002614 [Mortierella sp. 14UC]